MPRIRVFAGWRGFSLVELLIVTALIAMMALIAAPWFVKLHRRNQIKSAASEIQTTLLAARMKAVRLNQPVSVVISSVTPPLTFQTVEPNPPAATPTPVPRVLALPADAAQFVATPGAPGGAITFGGDGRLANFAVPTPAVLIVEGPVGAGPMMNQITIRTSSIGRVEVVTPAVWK